jgi:hypothetical protein
MEKPKTSSNRRHRYQLLLTPVLILVAIYLIPGLIFGLKFFVGTVATWTLIPSAYPNALIITKEELPYDFEVTGREISITYCTNTTIEDLEIFFYPLVGEFRNLPGPSEEFTHSASNDVENDWTNLFLLQPYYWILIAPVHPDCASGAVYKIYVAYTE